MQRKGEEMGGFQSFVVRPAMVLKAQRGWGDWVMRMAVPCIGVDELSASMLELAVRGSSSGEVIWENRELRRWGRELLDAGK